MVQRSWHYFEFLTTFAFFFSFLSYQLRNPIIVLLNRSWLRKQETGAVIGSSCVVVAFISGHQCCTSPTCCIIIRLSSHNDSCSFRNQISIVFVRCLLRIYARSPAVLSEISRFFISTTHVPVQFLSSTATASFTLSFDVTSLPIRQETFKWTRIKNSRLVTRMGCESISRRSLWKLRQQVRLKRRYTPDEKRYRIIEESSTL